MENESRNEEQIYTEHTDLESNGSDVQKTEDIVSTEGSEDDSDTKLKKKRRKPRKLFWLLFRNTIFVWLAALIVLGLIIYFTWKYPILYRNASHVVQSLDELQDWYDEKCYNVTYHAFNLKYTGYDYYENEKLVGAYYYTFEGDRCLFVLLNTRNPHSLISSATVRGKLIKDSAHMEAVLDQFASDAGIDKEAFFQVVYPLMISEIDYPWTQTVLIWILIILPAVLTVLVLVLGIDWTIQPYMHPNMKRLEKYGKRKAVYYEINSQLNRDNVVHRDHYYFTDEYLIFDNIGYLEFVRMDKVRFISKHATKDKKKRQKYRLTMSDEENTYFEHDFKSEECVDAIMKQMIARNAQIDDRTLHVFNLPAEETAALPPEEGAAEALVMTTETDTMSTEEDITEAETDTKESDTGSIHVSEAHEQEKTIGIDDAEDLKIYNVRRRLRKKDEEADQVKIYNVRRRLRHRNREAEPSQHRSDN